MTARDDDAGGGGAPSFRSLPPAGAAALVFATSGAVLVLEILGIRFLAPYVGLTLETTTSIIGVVLGGIAVGSAAGGRLADEMNPRVLVALLVLAGGGLALLTVPLVRALGPGVEDSGDAGALFLTLVALLPAAAVLSAVTPAVARLQLRDLRMSGTVYGRLSAWATAGALAGTLGTGFVLVPLLPVTTSVLLVGGGLVATGVVLALRAGLSSRRAAAGAAGVAVLLAAASALVGADCDTESTYHCARVEIDPDRDSGRVLVLDDLRHSYVDLDDPMHLEFPYIRWIAGAIDALAPEGRPVDAVFVGGGGFTLPRWLEVAHPGSTSHVLEVDEGVVDLGRDRLGLETSDDLRVEVGDARVTLRDRPSGSADVVVGDAFSSRSVPWHLTTREWLTDVRRVLRPGGIYALNLIGRDELDLLRAEAATLLESFADVVLVRDGTVGEGNFVLVASDRPIPAGFGPSADGAQTLGRAAVAELAAGADVLTDDDAPADQLLS